MREPQVTVVIPTRNRVDLLEEAVASARAADLDVVVVDDGSDDRTPTWLAEQADPALRWIRVDPPRERSAARNAGLDLVVTPYVLFLDDDDVLVPGGVERLVASLGRHPHAVAAAGTYVTFGSYAAGEVARRQMTSPVEVLRCVWRELLWGWNIQPGAGLWRTERLRALGGWDEGVSFAEDFELNLRTYPHPVVVVPCTVSRYRHHGFRAAGAERDRQRAQDAAVRRAFVDRLPAHHRAEGEAILRAKPLFDAALEAYTAGDVRGAVGGFLRAHREAPSLLASPVVGPWMGGLLGKALAAALLPAPLRQRAIAGHRAHRGRGLVDREAS